MTVHSTMCFLSNIQTIYLTKTTNEWKNIHTITSLKILCRLNPVVNVQHIGCKGIQYRRALALSEMTNKMTNQSFTVMSDAFGKKQMYYFVVVVVDDDKYYKLLTSNHVHCFSMQTTRIYYINRDM